MSFKALRLLLAAVALVAGIAHGQIAQPLVGQSVQAVLDELRAAGAPLVYSSALVPGTLTVSAEPLATEPLEVAREVLAPHGLAVRVEAGAWLVVRAEVAAAPGGIIVQVASAYSGTPMRTFTIQVEGPTPHAAEGSDGHAELVALAPGRYTVVVRAQGFLT